MISRLALRILVLAVIIGVVAILVPGIHVHGGFPWLLAIAALFTLVNMIMRPILIVLGLPLIILSVGLFLLVINAALLGITAALTSHLDISSFWSALFGALLISVFTGLTAEVLPIREDEQTRRRR
jgi:putative membrane protein